jgi:lipid-A-disaccharide synthase-like uncharacterized protein
MFEAVFSVRPFSCEMVWKEKKVIVLPRAFYFFSVLVGGGGRLEKTA